MPGGASDDRIRAERVRTVSRAMPVTLLVTALNAVVTAAVLMPVSDHAALFTWVGLATLLTATRLVLWRRLQHLDPAYGKPGRWALLLTAGSLASGLLWGFGSFVLFPAQPVFQMFLAFVTAGMCAGAVTVSSPNFPTLLAFVIPATLPLADRFALAGSPRAWAMAGMVVIFATALTLIARRVSHEFGTMLRLQVELAERTRELDATNASLRAEIAERRVTEATLRQAQKLEAMGQLTGGLAHDFNNLLTAMIGFVTLAIYRLGDDSPAKPLLDNALKAADGGAALTRRLLAFARKQVLSPKPVDVATLTTSLEDLLQRTLGAQVRLAIRAAPDLPPAMVDANQLELAILNLAINARDAMPDGGDLRIAIVTRRAQAAPLPGLADGLYVVLAISDTGTGMDEETVARAFEPFFTTKASGAGSGLGLSMVQGFAAQSGGAVTIASAVGQGTTVEIWLPRAAAPAVIAPDDQPDRLVVKRGGARILVCDDDPAVRAVTSRSLSEVGHTVDEVDGPEAALRHLEGHGKVDLLVTDLTMSGMSGVDLIHAARTRRIGLRVLLITGHAPGFDERARGFPVLFKPFKPDDLARRVAELLQDS